MKIRSKHLPENGCQSRSRSNLRKSTPPGVPYPSTPIDAEDADATDNRRPIDAAGDDDPGPPVGEVPQTPTSRTPPPAHPAYGVPTDPCLCRALTGDNSDDVRQGGPQPPTLQSVAPWYVVLSLSKTTLASFRGRFRPFRPLHAR